MKKMFLLFSHHLTDNQISDAKQNYNIEKFVSLPIHLQNIWRNISPYSNTITSSIKEIIEFLDKNATENDFVLIQGDFGATCIMVNYSFRNNLIPIYSTTKRISYETTQNESVNKLSMFKHVKYRQYEIN